MNEGRDRGLFHKRMKLQELIHRRMKLQELSHKRMQLQDRHMSATKEVRWLRS